MARATNPVAVAEGVNNHPKVTHIYHLKLPHRV